MFNLNNQLTNWNGSPATSDANGDPANMIGNTFSFDARHRLTQVYTSAFLYDTFGRRIGKFVAGVTTYFLYDGPNAVQENQGSTVTGILTGLGIDERFSRDESAGKRYYFTDALGSTIALTDAANAVQQTYQYAPYGESTSSGASNNPYQYTGRENDGGGLYYLRARYYSPVVKRFVSEDPIGLGGGLNEYDYGAENPISLVDPQGLIGVDPNGIVPGGPWTPANGQRPGSFWGPPNPPGGGGRVQCQYVPPAAEGGTPGSSGYWKTNAPSSDWQRCDKNGQPQTPDEAHPNPRPGPPGRPRFTMVV